MLSKLQSQTDADGADGEVTTRELIAHLSSFLLRTVFLLENGLSMTAGL
jgi:hypothetical protein